MNKYNFLKICLRIAKKEKIDFDRIDIQAAFCAFYENDCINDYFRLSIQENKYIPFYKKPIIEWYHLENINSIYALLDKDRLYNLNNYF